MTQWGPGVVELVMEGNRRSIPPSARAGGLRRKTILGEGYTRRHFLWIAKRVTLALGDVRFSRHMMRDPLFLDGPYDYHAQHHDFFDLIDFDERLPLFEYELPRITRNRGRTSLCEATFEYDTEGIMRKEYLFDVPRIERLSCYADPRQPQTGSLPKLDALVLNRLLIIAGPRTGR